MRSVRLLCWFVVGVLLSSVAMLSYAETKPAEMVYSFPQFGCGESDYAAAKSCLETNYWAQYHPPAGCVFSYSGAYGEMFGLSGGCSGSGQLTYRVGCPEGWTLSGQTCTRSDECPSYSGTATDSLTQNPPAGCQCPSGSKWYPFNGCRKTCAWNAGEKVNAGWDMQYKAGGSVCAMGCESYGTGDYLIGKDGMRTGPVESSGWACGVGAPTSPVPPDDTAKIPEGAKHPPKCAATEGVMTSSSGNVLCVPEGTPAASKPNVESKKKTEVFPDNSTKTTETTKTTDPNTNATDTRSTTTSTGGQSGPAGTGTTTENTSGDSGSGSGGGEGDEDGDCDPKKHFCSKPSTEGLYEKKETTFGGVLGKFTTDMKNTPIGQAVETTLNITVPSSGACPDLSANIPYLNTTIDLAPYLCTGKAIEYMEVMGTILKICVGYIALTWVFL